MSLRDEIATRLFAYHLAQFREDRRPQAMFNRAAAELLADEVIRLMEWARRKNVTFVQDNWQNLISAEFSDLTLPPEDWKP